MAQKRGSIGFFATYRPPVPIDIYSCSIRAESKHDEIQMTDGEFSNYNAQVIPSEALKAILKRLKMVSKASEANVDSGLVGRVGPDSGMVFVSERTDNLETLHIALRYEDDPPKVKVVNFADVYDTFRGVRMEDSGCIAGYYLIYVSTMEQADERRQPWTAVYKTNLLTGRTDRITPEGEAHLSPSVSPSGKKIAVASFEDKGGWDGENEDLMTSIFVMNVEKPYDVKRLTSNGGWPTWGSDDVLYFHRKVGNNWAVFRAGISNDQTNDEIRVTPEGIDAVTPAAIDADQVAVATIRKKSKFEDVRDEAQYRHIEIFYSPNVQKPPIKITQNVKSLADHFNPFVIADKIKGEKRIGYHCCRRTLLKKYNNIPSASYKLASPLTDVGLFRVPGPFPTFSLDGTKLAFVDNEFKAVWLADSKGLRRVYEAEGVDNVFSPVWNQNPNKDILYVCMGPSFHAEDNVEIYAIPQVSTCPLQARMLTSGYNDAFPSTNADGKKLVFRSTRNGGGKSKKNLYIMDNAEVGQFDGGKITQLTDGDCIDTHCKWSPSADLIVFSSNRDRTADAPKRKTDPDSGYFAVYLVRADAPKSAPIRVITSGSDVSGHVNHPFFSPDGLSILVVSDLAGVSVDPISLPLFLHSVRPYGDLFTVDIDPNDMKKNKDLKKFRRITHSRYGNSTGTWTMFSTEDPGAAWNIILKDQTAYTSACPYLQANGGESFHMTGHLCIPERSC